MVSPVEIADIIELRSWGSGESVTLSQLEGEIAAAIAEEAIDVDEQNAEERFAVLAEQVFEELRQRPNAIGAVYPFECDGYRITYRPGNQPCSAYIFCLLLSYLPPRLIGNEQRTFQFETLAMEAAKNFFGGSAVRIGWPWEKTPYSSLLEDVIDLLPSLGQVNLPEPVNSGDRGWDIIVVKSFADNHYPKLVALGNCATGRKNWKDKGMESQPDNFWICFQHQMPGTFLTFTAVPFRMNSDSRIKKASRSNLTFDRYRICEHATALNFATQTWCTEQKQAACDVPLDQSV